jgi:hypothetical protein
MAKRWRRVALPLGYVVAIIWMLFATLAAVFALIADGATVVNAVVSALFVGVGVAPLGTLHLLVRRSRNAQPPSPSAPPKVRSSARSPGDRAVIPLAILGFVGIVTVVIGYSGLVAPYAQGSEGWAVQAYTAIGVGLLVAGAWALVLLISAFDLDRINHLVLFAPRGSQQHRINQALLPLAQRRRLLWLITVGFVVGTNLLGIVLIVLADRV